MIDPFGGSGGFTLNYASYLRDNFNNIDWSDNVNNIYHFDMEESVVKMTGLEMFAITNYFPKKERNYERINSFKYEFPDKYNDYQKFYYVISNPPYGGDKNNTPLLYAVKNNNYEICKLLIDAGADIHAMNMYKTTPLQYATHMNYTEIIDLLKNEITVTNPMHMNRHLDETNNM
jgi:ankyrin repeat protein